MDEFAGKRVVVLGAGRSGVAAASALARRGAQVTVYDRKPLAELPHAEALLTQGIPLHAERDAPASLQGYDLVVVSPGAPPTHPIFALADAAGVPVWSEIELGYRIARAPIIAITGTNGKTTTTMLIHHILRTMGLQAHLCGNIAGIEDEQTLTEAAEHAAPDSWLVAEVSSFQLLHTHAFCPKVAVLLNIRDDHLDYHGSWEAYARAKAKILVNQTPDDWAVLNADDAGVQWVVEQFRLPSPPVSLSHETGEGVDLPSYTGWESGQGGEVSDRQPSPPVPLSRETGEGANSPSPTAWERGDVLAFTEVSDRQPSPPVPLSRETGEGVNSPSPTQWERGQGGEGRKARPKHPDLRISRGLIQMARDLRKRATPPEQLLWELLRNRRLGGIKFRRQHPIGGFVADFYCSEAALIIELDGGVHLEPTQLERDRIRQQIREAYGLACLRFSNAEITRSPERVLRQILETSYQRIQSFSKQPSPPALLSRETGEGAHPPSPTQWERGQGGEGTQASPATPPSASDTAVHSPSPTQWERGQGGEGTQASPATPPSASDTAVHSPSPTQWERGQGGEGKILYFSAASPFVKVSGENLNIADLFKPALQGMHGLENALAAACVAGILGCTAAQLREAFASFRGAPHRMEFVGEWGGVRYINNSMCTNADALEKSLQATPKPCIVIAGGVDKNASIPQLAESLARHAGYVLLIGRDGQAIGDALQARGYTHWEYVESLAQAVSEASRLVRAGETVILAPGCASFDQFRNFADRGEQFKRLIREVHGCDGRTH